ncbi:MAG: hypothetical protein HQL48_10155, partial [Gammaproteobacteria bacterium]|nr:hypothetical protein [Gammaproteobacteria bacterium]
MDFLAPTDPESDICRLLAATGQQGDDVTLLRQLFWSLNAPAQLIRFNWLVVHRLQPLLQERSTFAKGGVQIDFTPLERAEQACEVFIASCDALKKAHPNTFSPLFWPAQTSHTQNPMRKKGMVRHALYATLFHLPQQEDAQEVWRRIALLLWLGHANLMNQETTLESYEDYNQPKEILRPPYSIDNAARHLRELSNASWHAELTRDKGSLTTIDAILNRLESLGKNMRPLYIYCSKCFGRMDWVRRSASSRPGRKRGKSRSSGWI